jgi:hypothetical protein
MPQGPIFNKIYDLEYYSDSSMMLYIGDVWVDEITAIGYTCRQEKSPIYGYASQLFDDTAAGHVLVQGSLAINFKEAGYLWAVLRRWFDMGPGAPQFVEKGLIDPVDQKKSAQLIKNKIQPGAANKGARPIVGSNGSIVSRATIERIAQGEASTAERNEFYHSLAGYATFSGSPKDKIFEDIVEAFEDELWKTTDNDALLSQIRRMDDNAFDGFDIYLSFGNMANKYANHTAKKIVGVRLLSQGLSVQVGQGPIQETYEFIAQCVV